MGFFRVSLAFTAVLGLCGAARAARDIAIVVDMSLEGRKVAHPTSQNPAYYLPTMRGYQAMGDMDTGQVPPSPHAIAHLVAVELAKQGYLVANAVHKNPQLMIDISWGYINPSNDTTNDIQWNQGQMYGLVLGHNISNVIPYESVGREQLLVATKQNRYFIILTAYDYTAYAKSNKRVMLWTAKMSVPSDGLFFTDVMDSMVKAGGPSFGVETVGRPKLVPAVPDGQVIIGTPTVKKDPVESLAPDAK